MHEEVSNVQTFVCQPELYTTWMLLLIGSSDIGLLYVISIFNVLV